MIYLGCLNLYEFSNY